MIKNELFIEDTSYIPLKNLIIKVTMSSNSSYSDTIGIKDTEYVGKAGVYNQITYSYSEKLVIGRLYYIRGDMKNSASSLLPTWVRMYLSAGYVSVAGYSSSKTTYTTCSGIGTITLTSLLYSYSSLYVGTSGATNSQGYLKNPIVCDVTDLYKILKARGIATTELQLKTWCDNNILYHLFGETFNALKKYVLTNCETFNGIDDAATVTEIVKNNTYKISLNISGKDNAALRVFKKNSEFNNDVTRILECDIINHKNIDCIYFREGSGGLGSTNFISAEIDGINYNISNYSNGTQCVIPYTSNSSIHVKFKWKPINTSTNFSALYISCNVGLNDVITKPCEFTISNIQRYVSNLNINISKICLNNNSFHCNEIIEPDGLLKYINTTSTGYKDVYQDSQTNFGVYNNSGNGTVTHALINADSTSPFYPTHKKVARIITNGTASPGTGGFYPNVLISYANAIFLLKIVAKIPVGYTITNYANAMGTGYTSTWLTPRKGTGKYEEYTLLIKCGSSGTFSSGGHIALVPDSGYSATSVTWYVAYQGVFDITGNEYLKGFTLLKNSMSSKCVVSNEFNELETGGKTLICNLSPKPTISKKPVMYVDFDECTVSGTTITVPLKLRNSSGGYDTYNSSVTTSNAEIRTINGHKVYYIKTRNSTNCISWNYSSLSSVLAPIIGGSGTHNFGYAAVFALGSGFTAGNLTRRNVMCMSNTMLFPGWNNRANDDIGAWYQGEISDPVTIASLPIPNYDTLRYFMYSMNKMNSGQVRERYSLRISATTSEKITRLSNTTLSKNSDGSSTFIIGRALEGSYYMMAGDMLQAIYFFDFDVNEEYNIDEFIENKYK